MGRSLIQLYKGKMRDPFMGNTLPITIKITFYSEGGPIRIVEIINPEENIVTEALLQPEEG